MSRGLVAHYHHNIAQLFRIEQPRDDGGKKRMKGLPHSGP